MADQTRTARQSLRRAIRHSGLSSSPLRRGSDRLEFVSRLLCALALLSALPVALAVGTVVGADAAQQAREQAAARHEVDAVLIADAPDAGPGDIGALSAVTPVTWHAADGSAVTGVVRAPLGETAGDRVEVWVDQAGRQTAPPLDSAGVATSSLLAGIFTLLGLAGVAGGMHAAVCHALWRHRARQWEQGWRAVEPVWTGRLGPPSGEQAGHPAG